MGRRLLRLAGFASGALAGTIAYRRRFGPSREQIEIYFDDGSFVTFVGRSAEALRLLPLARRVLATVRPA